MNNKMETDNSGIETLELNDAKSNHQDIPTTFFKPIDEIQEQQESLIKKYEEQQEKDELPMIDLSNEVRALESKLNKKKFYIPFSYVLVIIVIINLAWFLGVKFLIVPKYEDYVSQNEEIKQNYESLKRKVDAIVGE